MGLLHEIQASLLSNTSDIGPILLKLKFLASRLGDHPLEEWVKHESEGYPPDVEVPSYRVIGVSYVGTFSGAFGRSISNAPIPPYLIDKYCGPKWTNYEIRQSIAGLDHLIASNNDDGRLTINAANLILLLQGHIYDGLACNSVTGTISIASIAEIKYAVRNRILQVTLEIEKALPDAAKIEIGPVISVFSAEEKEKIMNVTNTIVYGDSISVSNSGDSSVFSTSIKTGDRESLVNELVKAGIAQNDARDFAVILSEEKPSNPDQPFGAKAQSWLAKSMSKALDGTWKAGLAAATAVLTEAAKRYYGLK